MVADLLGIDESEQTALLSWVNEKDEREFQDATRDQNGKSGTWLWTEEQAEVARKNPIVRDSFSPHKKRVLVLRSSRKP